MMKGQTEGNYSALDQPEVLEVLFHPRGEYGHKATGESAHDVMIPVEDTVSVGACFHVAKPLGANILFFHGNGEIVADYAELGPLYNRMGINFLAVDYRGYGRSQGQPTVTAMMKDCHKILDWVEGWLRDNGYNGPLVVMGRSLGSASALELAGRRPNAVDGLIIESGFAYAAPLLRLLGISAEAVKFREEDGFRNIDKIGRFEKPTLIIHAEFDHIIPFSDGKALYDASPALQKDLLKIPGANHNDIFARGLADYLKAVEGLTRKLAG